MKYAQAILDNGFSPGVIMIDDTWQEDYGKWNFHPGRFPNPKEMMDQLHQMGFKVMLWMCPFVSADQTMIIQKLMEYKAFLMQKKEGEPNSTEGLAGYTFSCPDMIGGGNWVSFQDTKKLNQNIVVRRHKSRL